MKNKSNPSLTRIFWVLSVIFLVNFQPELAASEDDSGVSVAVSELNQSSSSSAPENSWAELLTTARTTVAQIANLAKSGLNETETAAVNFFGVICDEVSRVQGDRIAEQWTWVVQRYQSDQVGRSLWTLILVLFTSGFIFVVSVGYGLCTRLTRSRRKHKTKPIQAKKPAANTKSYHEAVAKNAEKARQPSVPRTMIGKLKAGMLEEVEQALMAERKRRPEHTGLTLYLLACRAASSEPEAYQSLVSEIFSGGLDKESEIGRHAAQIGRIMFPEKYPVDKYPEPKKPFEVEANLIGDTLGPISEFGNVQTLLDLVRVYVEMKEWAETKHLIVEILVRGDASQRERALEYSRIIRKDSSNK